MALFLCTVSLILLAFSAWLAIRLERRTHQSRWVVLALAFFVASAIHAFGIYSSLSSDTPHSIRVEIGTIAFALISAAVLLVIRRKVLQRPVGEAMPSHRRLTHAAVLLGSLAVLGGYVIGYLAYHSSRDVIVARTFKNNLSLARAFGASIAVLGSDADRTDRLMQLEHMWAQVDEPYEKSYLCVIGRDGRLILHTEAPDLIGTDVGDTSVPGTSGDVPRTMRQIIETEGEFVGYLTSLFGEDQIVALSYSPAIDGLIAVHSPIASVDAQIRKALLPWGIGLGLISLILFPICLALLQRVASSAQRAMESAHESRVQSERRYRTVVERVPMVLWGLDSEGRFTFAEGKAIDLFGLTPEQLIGRSVVDIFRRETPDIEEKFRAALRGELSTSTDKVNGKVLEERFSRSIGPDGEATGLIGIATDVTALRDSEQRNRAIIDAVPDMMIRMRRDGTFLDFKAAKDLVPLAPPEDLIGKTVRDIIPPEVAEPSMQKIHDTLETRETQFHEYQLEVDGRLHEFESRYVVCGNDEVFAMIRDVTERKQAEKALRQSEERYRRLFEEDITANFICTPKGEIVACNAAFAEVFGFESLDAAIGTKFEPLWPERQVRREFWKDLSKKKKLVSYEAKLVRLDGETISVIGNINGRYGKDGQLTQVIGYLFDITERRNLEAQLRQSQKMEAVGRLAGGVAHDFNNLLTAISGYSQLIQMRLAKDDPVCTDIEEIIKAGERATSLTRQLLSFSRKQALQPGILDINTIVLDMNRMLRRLIGADIELVTVLGNELAPIKADPGGIEQVIMNLAINARDAMAGGGKLTIETANVTLDRGYARRHVGVEAGPHVLLSVRDTGIGMVEEVQSLIFEPFYTTKEHGKGTGLGLTTVYGIIKQSGGHIVVSSAKSSGSTFRIYFPRTRGSIVERGRREVPVEAYSGSETILLVEDEDIVRNLARRILARGGYKVIEARNGGDALQIAKDQTAPIHVLVTDIVMPQMNGQDLAREMRKLDPNLKVIFMSGYTGDLVIQDIGDDSGMLFLQKPFTPNALLEKVRSLLDATAPTHPD